MKSTIDTPKTCGTCRKWGEGLTHEEEKVARQCSVFRKSYRQNGRACKWYEPHLFQKLTLGIDFDGTIVECKYPEIGELLPHAKEVLQWAHSQGHCIVINSCRAGNKIDEARQFLEENGVPFDYFNENNPEKAARYGSDTRKISADIYVDDRDASNILTGVDWLKIKETILTVSEREARVT